MRNSLACCYFAVVRVFPFLFFFLMWTRFGRANQWAVGTGARTRAFGARTARVCGTCGVGAGGFCPSRCWSRRARVRKGEGKTGRVSLEQSSPHTPPVGACLTASPNLKARNSVQNTIPKASNDGSRDNLQRLRERRRALPSPQTPLRMGTQTHRQLAKSRPLCHSNLIFPCGFRKWFADDDDDNNNKQLQVEARCS